VWLLSWSYFIHLTAVPVLFLLYATVFFYIFLHIYLQLRFVICILYNKWMILSKMVSVIFAVLEMSFWALTTAVKLLRKFLTLMFAVLFTILE